MQPLRVLSVAIILAAAALPARSAPAPAAADVFPARLAEYRADPRCTGASYDEVIGALNLSVAAYRLSDPVSGQPSVVKGMIAAAREDDLAAAALAKGCKIEAMIGWRDVIRSFDGPAFLLVRQRALAGIRAVRGR